jgi:NADH dehydrogenase (ubiquinone) 1 beta subcomplex subunit 3
MGVKQPGEAPKTHAEIMKLVEEGLDVERDKLFNKSSIFRLRPPYNNKALHEMSFAPWHPEMNQVGYEHKIHGTQVIPDHRIYQPERVAKTSSHVRDYMEELKTKGLKDPWLRNEVWRRDPYCGYDTPVRTTVQFVSRGMKWGAILAVTSFMALKVKDFLYPPHEHHTDRWWELRETPEPNIITHRQKPFRMIHGVICVSKNIRHGHWWSQDVGVVQDPPKEWYCKDKDPALICG